MLAALVTLFIIIRIILVASIKYLNKSIDIVYLLKSWEIFLPGYSEILLIAICYALLKFRYYNFNN